MQQTPGLALGIRLGPAVLSLVILIFSLAWYSDSQADPVLSVDGTASYAYPGDQTAYTIELLNHTDQILYDGVISITLPAGFTYVTSTTLIMGEGWPMDSHEPVITGQTLSWGPYHLPAAGVEAHNPYGIHTLMNCGQGIPTLHLEGAKVLAGSGGYVTQLFYPITTATSGPSQCAVNFVQEAYTRNLIPIIRLGGYSVNGIWQAPDPGLNGDYAEIAQAFARFVAGLPRRDANPLYIQIWNEPDLWIEWNNKPNAAQYARFFVAASGAIKRLGDARIRIVNGALTPGNAAFLKRLLQVPGFKDAFDVWASHCYPYNHPPSYNNHNGSARYGTYTLVDWQRGQVVARLPGLGRVRGIAWDATTGRLFAVEAEHERLLVLKDDLSELITTLALDDQPDQIILDSAARHLYLSFPAVPQVIAVDADTLAVTARTELTGGPILDLAFDEKRQRLYALNLLAPRHQGLTVWRTPMLDRLDLVAGTGDFSLRTASTVEVMPDGDLLISEAAELWRIAPDDFVVRRVYLAGTDSPAADLAISQRRGAAYLLEPLEHSLRIYEW